MLLQLQDSAGRLVPVRVADGLFRGPIRLLDSSEPAWRCTAASQQPLSVVEDGPRPYTCRNVRRQEAATMCGGKETTAEFGGQNEHEPTT